MGELVKRVFTDPTVKTSLWEIPLKSEGIDLISLKPFSGPLMEVQALPIPPKLDLIPINKPPEDAVYAPIESEIADLALMLEDQLAVLIGTPEYLLHVKHSEDGFKNIPFLAYISIGPGQAPPQIYTIGHNYLGHLHDPPNLDQLLFSIKRAFRFLTLERENEILNLEVRGASSKVAQLNNIGVALSAERDTDTLLNMILTKTREITNSDAGSLYLVEEIPEADRASHPEPQNTKRLRFKLSQNDSIEWPKGEEFTLPINTKSLAGYSAATGNVLSIPDCYELDAASGFTFNKDFDARMNYRTRSMVVVPMINHREEIIGVLQLINRKIDPKTKLTPENALQNTIPYDDETKELVWSLGSQAAVTVQTNQFLESIEILFERFVNASVKAIEGRDPATGGHSGRVADLTVGLAEAINKESTGPYAAQNFTYDEIREIRYASLLHDFGKVGVAEEVLKKAEKLYKDRMELIRSRFFFAKLRAQYRHLDKQFQFVLQSGKDQWLKEKEKFDKEAAEELRQLDLYLETIEVANIPPLVRKDQQDIDAEIELLKTISHSTYEDIFGKVEPLLYKDEFTNLCIQKGSLNDGERKMIEEHVTHTFNFLSTIPWTPEMKNVPEIAHGHHEKLNGKGYPVGKHSDQILIGSKMMAISDIYDALTASDRPYKKAVETPRALQILSFEVKDGHLDADLLNIFSSYEVYKRTQKTI